MQAEVFRLVGELELGCQAEYKDTFLGAALRNVLIVKALELCPAASAHYCRGPLGVGYTVGMVETEGSVGVCGFGGIEKEFEAVAVVCGNVLGFCFFPPSLAVVATSVSNLTFASLCLLPIEGGSSVLGLVGEQVLLVV